jgi:hypothetical protein
LVDLHHAMFAVHQYASCGIFDQVLVQNIFSPSDSQ